ncbi:hypothetical protein V8E53_006296 [Lactarius tabidus]
MGSCCSTPSAHVTSVVATRVVPSREQSPPGTATAAPQAPSEQSGAKSRRESPQVEEAFLRDLPLLKFSPQKVQLMTDGKDLLRVPPPRSWATSSVTLSNGSTSSGHRPSSGEHSIAFPTRSTKSYPARRLLNSTVRQVLSEGFQFRVLVVGKHQSGKSSLIKAVFKVDVPTRNVDIDVEFRPEDNPYLIVHECSGFDAQVGGSQNLQTIREFISHRTHATRSLSERLHAVWWRRLFLRFLMSGLIDEILFRICIPASDAIAGKLGEGVEEILGMTNVSVVLVLTKFDIVVSEVLSDIARGDVLQHERARARAHAMYEVFLRRRFDKVPRDVPAEIVSAKPIYVDLIENLVATTDRFILGSRRPSTGFGVPGERSRVSPVPLAWSAALRVNHNVVLQALIEVGRSRYWRRLWASVDFADHPLKSCVNIIHVDLVEIWNLNDKTGYLASDEFKAKVSHLIGDLVGPGNVISDPYPSGTEVGFADWVHGVYKGSRANVRCIMGYIIDLTVVLDVIFSAPSSGDISREKVRLVFEWFVSSGHKEKIHRQIRGFVRETFAVRVSVPQTDLILERIIDLIQESCVPARNGSIPLAAGSRLTGSHVDNGHGHVVDPL